VEIDVRPAMPASMLAVCVIIAVGNATNLTSRGVDEHDFTK
jgi:hypothetical protein